VGNNWTVDAAGNLTLNGSVAALGTITGVALATNLTGAAQYINMSSVSLVATGTNPNIDINITPRGAGNVVMSSVDINGGTIDGTIIGATSAANGTFAVLSSTSLAVSGSASFGDVSLLDTDSSNSLRLVWNENDIADRILNFLVNAGNRTLSMTGNAILNQDVSTVASPEFAGLVLTGLTGVLIVTAGVVAAGTLDDITDNTYAKVLATSLTVGEVTKLTDIVGDDLTIALGGADRVLTLGGDTSLNQDLQTTDAPTFATLTAMTALIAPVATLTAADINANIITLTGVASVSTPVYTQGGGAAHDDMTAGIVFTGTIITNYQIIIDGVVGPDTFTWTDDGGGSWTAGVTITGAAQTLSDGVEITFAATTGHEIGDQWDFLASPYTGRYITCIDNVAATVFNVNAIGNVSCSSINATAITATSLILSGALAAQTIAATLSAAVGTTLVVSGASTIGAGAVYGGGRVSSVVTVQTTDTTITPIISLAVIEDETWLVKVHVIGQEDSTPSTNRAAYYLEGLFYRVDGGGLTQQGSTSVVIEEESDATWDCDFGIDAVNDEIDVDVTGVAATTINWKCWYEYIKVT